MTKIEQIGELETEDEAEVGYEGSEIAGDVELTRRDMVQCYQ